EPATSQRRPTQRYMGMQQGNSSPLALRLPARMLAAAVLLLGLTGCFSETYQKGYIVPEGALEQVPIGASQEQVLILLGTPSTVATVSGEAFYYISQRAERPVAFMSQETVDQRVIAVYFDRNRRVVRLANYGIKDGKLFDFVSRTTPTGGRGVNYPAHLFPIFSLETPGQTQPFPRKGQNPRRDTPRDLPRRLGLGDRAADEMHDLDHVVIGVMEVGAAALERSGAAVFLLEDLDALGCEEHLGAIVFLTGQTECAVDLVSAFGVRIDGLFREGQHKARPAGRAHEHHVVIAPDPLQAHDFGIKLFRPVESLDRDREMQNAFGLQHRSPPRRPIDMDFSTAAQA